MVYALLIAGLKGFYNGSSQIHSSYVMLLQFLWKNKLVQFKLQLVAGSEWYNYVCVMVSIEWLVTLAVSYENYNTSWCVAR